MPNTPEISLNSPFAKTIIKFESLRNSSPKPLKTTSPNIFSQLNSLILLLEAAASAALADNQISLPLYLEKHHLPAYKNHVPFIEITNLYNALNFINETIDEATDKTAHQNNLIDPPFIRKLHRLAVKNLPKQRTRSPINPATIKQLRAFTDRLNSPADPNKNQFESLEIALAAQDFAKIRPFPAANGRTARLLIYALLRQKGYLRPNTYRIFSPTHALLTDPKISPKTIAKSGLGRPKRFPEPESFLSALLAEADRTERLADQAFVANELLYPVIDVVLRAGLLSALDAKILRRAAKLGTFKSADIEDLWRHGASRVTIAKHLNRLKTQGYIRPIRPGGRIYELRFDDNQLTRPVLERISPYL